MKMDSMKDRICMITGANSGIGKVTALELARMEGHIIMVCRNKAKGLDVQRTIVESTGNPDVELMIADLASQESIRQLVKKFHERFDKLHVLINNAGTMTKNRIETVDGHETTFAVNHLAPFLLTNLLLDTIKASAPSRIITVSSGMHHRVTINLDDLQGVRNFKNMNAYSMSKLANIIFTYELHHRLRAAGINNVSVNAVHPGFARTNLGKNGTSTLLQRVGLALVHPIIGISAEKGAETSIYVASSPEIETVSGKYFAKKKVAESSPLSHDRSLQKQLWEISAKLTDL
jgi:NAD(P)-dependent dehydrogenase (short-subunit alcohol dehydrogenase family)